MLYLMMSPSRSSSPPLSLVPKLLMAVMHLTEVILLELVTITTAFWQVTLIMEHTQHLTVLLTQKNMTILTKKLNTPQWVEKHVTQTLLVVTATKRRKSLSFSTTHTSTLDTTKMYSEAGLLKAVCKKYRPVLDIDFFSRLGALVLAPRQEEQYLTPFKSRMWDMPHLSTLALFSWFYGRQPLARSVLQVMHRRTCANGLAVRHILSRETLSCLAIYPTERMQCFSI